VNSLISVINENSVQAVYSAVLTTSFWQGRCPSSHNRLRGITHPSSPVHSNILLRSPTAHPWSIYHFPISVSEFCKLNVCFFKLVLLFIIVFGSICNHGSHWKQAQGGVHPSLVCCIAMAGQKSSTWAKRGFQTRLIAIAMHCFHLNVISINSFFLFFSLDLWPFVEAVIKRKCYKVVVI